MTKYLLFTILVLAASLAVSVKSCQDIRTDRNRLSDNQRTLLADIEFYRTKDSLSAASVERLTLTNREFRKYAGELKKTVEELNLKVKYLQSASQSATETKYLVKTEIRDSIVIRPGREPDTLNRIDFQDPYLTFSGTYIITVNADDAVIDFPPFKHFLFLYKLLSDDGKTLLVILCISE